MITLRGWMLGMVLVLVVGHLSAAGFLDALAPEQKKRLGLDHLTTQQATELDAAIEAYRKTGEAVVAQAAAASAVAEYRRKEEPAVISRAVETVKQQDSANRQDSLTAVVKGRFNGWTGGTLFTLDNGQVWRQSRPGTYYIKTREDVAVVIYKGPGGYWRLRILDDEGAWVTVVRVK